jgi:hypothetical protein
MDKKKSRLLFIPDDRPKFGREYCFLCGATLTAQRDTDEHVIPKWIQQRYRLWDRKLTLLNHTTIPYRQLTIPCCSTCNNECLGKIELQVQKAFDTSARAVRALPPLTLFIWAGKILYGLLYREHLLSRNRRAKEQGPIVSAAQLRQFRLHHQFLQAARVPFDFSPELPASLFVYETMEPSNRNMGFAYWDSVTGLGLSIRVGKVGLVACLQDGGAVRDWFGHHYAQYQKLKLHWVQFAEVTALTLYDLSRLNRVPKFLLFQQQGRAHVVLTPMGGLSAKPLFDDANVEDYARVLADCSQFPLQLIQPVAGRVMTWLRRSGKLNQMLPDDPP